MQNLLFFILFFLLACSGGSGGKNGNNLKLPDFTITTTQEVGPQGGTLLGSMGSAMEGLVMEIPAGALDRLTPIEIGIYNDKAQPSTPGGSELAGTFYYFGPSGTQFQKPITVTVPYDPKSRQAALVNEDINRLLSLLVYNQENKEWEEVPCEPNPVVFTCTGHIQHFSGVGVANNNFALFLEVSRENNIDIRGENISLNQPGNIILQASSLDDQRIGAVNFYERPENGPPVLVGSDDTSPYARVLNLGEAQNGIHTYYATVVEGNNIPRGFSNDVQVSVIINQACLPGTNVEIPDANLRQRIKNALRQQPLNPGAGDLVPCDQLQQLRTLLASAANIHSIEGLEHAIGLRTLDLSRNAALNDLTPLSNLTQLQSLNLSQDNLVDISVLGNLTGLVGLELGLNAIRDIRALAFLDQLTSLGLYKNRVTDLRPLLGMSSLRNPIAIVAVSANPLDLSEMSRSRQTIDTLLSEGVQLIWDELTIGLTGHYQNQLGMELVVPNLPAQASFDALIDKIDGVSVQKVDFYLGRAFEVAREFLAVRDLPEIGDNGYVYSHLFEQSGAFSMAAKVTTTDGAYAIVHLPKQVNIFAGREACDPTSAGEAGFLIGQWCAVNQTGPDFACERRQREEAEARFREGCQAAQIGAEECERNLQGIDIRINCPSIIMPACSPYTNQFEIIRQGDRLMGVVGTSVCEHELPTAAIICVTREGNEIEIQFEGCPGLGGAFPLSLHMTRSNDQELTHGFQTMRGLRDYPVDFDIEFGKQRGDS